MFYISWDTKRLLLNVSSLVLTYRPLKVPDPVEAEEGEDGAEDGPGRHVPGVMLVVRHAATGHYEGVHQGRHLGRGMRNNESEPTVLHSCRIINHFIRKWRSSQSGAKHLKHNVTQAS